MNSRNLALVSLLGALSAALEVVPGIPMPGAPYLKYDLAEAPVLIATLLLGPIYGFLSLRGLSIAILAVKGDPLGLMYKLVAVGSEIVFLRLLRESKYARFTASVGRSIVMSVFDRLTIPPLYGAPVNLEIVAIIFVFNLIQGSINASAAFYSYEYMRRGGMLCTLGLETCGQDIVDGS